MAVIRGNRQDNVIAATSPSDIVLGLAGNDVLSTTLERGDLRGAAGDDSLSAIYFFDGSGDEEFPKTLWRVLGGNGDDYILADVNVSDSAILEGPLGGGPSVDVFVDGGKGNDRIEVDAFVSNSNSALLSSNHEPPVLNVEVVDFRGDNSIEIRSRNFTFDQEPAETSTRIRLGSGDDRVAITGATDSDDYVSSNFYDINLGGGDNTVELDEFHGTMTFGLRSGSGSDVAELRFRSNEGNSHFVDTDIHIDLGGGDDLLMLFMESQQAGYTFVEADVVLGEGNNVAEIIGLRESEFKISAGSGDDVINLKLTMEGNFFADIPISEIRAGNGNNIVTVEQDYIARVVTGIGDDQIELIGGVKNIVRAGRGNDSIIAGSGEDNITLGKGADELVVKKEIFAGDDPQRLVVNDFNLSDGDSLTFAGWDIPALDPSGILDSLEELSSLLVSGGDVVSFSQDGRNAVLALDLGNGQVGEIEFKRLNLERLSLASEARKLDVQVPILHAVLPIDLSADCLDFNEPSSGGSIPETEDYVLGGVVVGEYLTAPDPGPDFSIDLTERCLAIAYPDQFGFPIESWEQLA